MFRVRLSLMDVQTMATACCRRIKATAATAAAGSGHWRLAWPTCVGVLLLQRLLRPERHRTTCREQTWLGHRSYRLFRLLRSLPRSMDRSKGLALLCECCHGQLHKSFVRYRHSSTKTSLVSTATTQCRVSNGVLLYWLFEGTELSGREVSV